uniref:SDR family NAD(P)-dependent oxidoreductase n=1 Tax=Pseudomonas koreensis TaxID=198620 RepID=UPI0013307A4E
MNRKIALITGASRGLGRSAALHLAAQGIDIIGTYNSRADEAQNLVIELQALGAKAAMLQLDVGHSEHFAAFAAQVAQVLEQTFERQRFDFLINNAGIGVHALFSETTPEQFEVVLRIIVELAFDGVADFFAEVDEPAIEILPALQVIAAQR